MTSHDWDFFADQPEIVAADSAADDRMKDALDTAVLHVGSLVRVCGLCSSVCSVQPVAVRAARHIRSYGQARQMIGTRFDSVTANKHMLDAIADLRDVESVVKVNCPTTLCPALPQARRAHSILTRYVKVKHLRTVRSRGRATVMTLAFVVVVGVMAGLAVLGLA